MKHCPKFILALIVLIIISSSVYSIHSTAFPDSRNLTEDSFNQSRPRVAVSGNTIHVVWESNRFTSGLGSDIFYRKSADGGNTWEQAVRLTDKSEKRRDPDVATYGNNVYVVWADERNSATTGSDIYIRRSEDNGVTWKPEEQLTYEANQWDPRIVASSEFVHLTWLDERNMATANYDIYYRRSPTSGRTWEGEQRLTSDPSDQWRQSVAASRNYVYVVYEDHRLWRYPPGSAGTLIYYARSTDAGASWSTENKLPTNGTWQFFPDVAAKEDSLYVAWSDGRNYSKTKRDIWFISSANHGGSWSNETRITSDLATQEYPRITVTGKDLYIVWQDLRNELTTGMDLYYRKGEQYGTDWTAEFGLTENQWQYNPAVASSGTQVHIVWTDERLWTTGGQEIFYTLLQ